MSTITVLAVIIVAALVVYVSSGGADFGGGIWQLLARGPRAEQQREALRHAIAPIWEANHVWLILVVVLLFACFPLAFSALMTALHVPIALMLIGIVLRGSTFVFRAYSAGAATLARRADVVFGVSSTASPFLLGVIAGAVAAGRVQATGDGVVEHDFVSPWLRPFPLAIGVFNLAMSAWLAAVYMTLEVDGALRDDFRRRALGAGIVVGGAAAAAALAAALDAPEFAARLFGSWWSLPFHAATGACALFALRALWVGRLHLARVLAIAQVGLVVTGWALAQYPLLIPPGLSFADAAAEPAVLRLNVAILAFGSLLLVPAFVYLFVVFKRR